LNGIEELLVMKRRVVRLFPGLGGNALDGLDGDVELIDVDVVAALGSGGRLAATGQLEPRLLPFGPSLSIAAPYSGLAAR
jgi:hypothetical protein